jgi:hypothetical protein
MENLTATCAKLTSNYRIPKETVIVSPSMLSLQIILLFPQGKNKHQTLKKTVDMTP